MRTGTHFARKRYGSGSIEEQATDRFGAIASAFDDDDLAAGQPDTGQRLNVRTVGYDKHISARRPSRDERAGAGGQGLPLILQHHDIAECRFGLDRPDVHQFGRIDASAPRRTQNFFERDPFPLELRSNFLCIRPPLFAEIALRGAASLKCARRDPVHSAMLRLGP